VLVGINGNINNNINLKLNTLKSTEFAYWLQGFFELSDTNTPLTEKQVQTIKNHLKLVFLHEIDPSYSNDPTVQKIMQNVHDGKNALDGIKVDKPIVHRVNNSNFGGTYNAGTAVFTNYKIS